MQGRGVGIICSEHNEYSGTGHTWNRDACMDMNVIRMCVGMSSVLRELLIWNTLQQQQKIQQTKL